MLLAEHMLPMSCCCGQLLLGSHLHCIGAFWTRLGRGCSLGPVAVPRWVTVRATLLQCILDTQMEVQADSPASQGAVDMLLGLLREGSSMSSIAAAESSLKSMLGERLAQCCTKPSMTSLLGEHLQRTVSKQCGMPCSWLGVQPQPASPVALVLPGAVGQV